MKQESLRRTPMNFAEEPVTYLSDLVAHVLCIERELTTENSNSEQPHSQAKRGSGESLGMTW